MRLAGLEVLIAILRDHPPRQDPCSLSHFLSWGMDYDNEAIAPPRLNVFILRESTYAALRPSHADFFSNFRPEPRYRSSCANCDCRPLSHFTSEEWSSSPARIRREKLARYNKYNNSNVYLPLHLYFTLFRLWLTNRYLIVVRTAFVFSFFLSFISFSSCSRRYRDTFSLLLRPVFPPSCLFLFLSSLRS